jgi:3-phenylpropionate/cinnamic acid dioxygenase small subunit
MITNVRIEPIDGGLLRVHSCFHCYRSRLDRDVETFVGRREDTLRPATSASWRIAQREIFLDQTVILAKNISIFL